MYDSLQHLTNITHRCSWSVRIKCPETLEQTWYAWLTIELLWLDLSLSSEDFIANLSGCIRRCKFLNFASNLTSSILNFSSIPKRQKKLHSVISSFCIVWQDGESQNSAQSWHINEPHFQQRYVPGCSGWSLDFSDAQLAKSRLVEQGTFGDLMALSAARSNISEVLCSLRDEDKKSPFFFKLPWSTALLWTCTN